jgi:hypothetical protein
MQTYQTLPMLEFTLHYFGQSGVRALPLGSAINIRHVSIHKPICLKNEEFIYFHCKYIGHVAKHKMYTISKI